MPVNFVAYSHNHTCYKIKEFLESDLWCCKTSEMLDTHNAAVIILRAYFYRLFLSKKFRLEEEKKKNSEMQKFGLEDL